MMDVMNELARIFQEVFDDDTLQIQPDTTSDDVDGWDSLSHINLVVAVEQFFKLRFGFGETQALKNVGDLQALVEKKMAK